MDSEQASPLLSTSNAAFSPAPNPASAPAVTHLKVEIQIEVNGQTAFKAHVDAEGDAQTLRPVAEQLSAAMAHAVVQAIDPQPSLQPTALPTAIVPSVQPISNLAASNAALSLSIPTGASSPTASRQPPATHRPILPPWLVDNRRLALGFGAVLVAAAILVTIVFPPLVPAGQRIEVFMMSLAFGLIGSGILFAGAMPRRNVASNLAAGMATGPAAASLPLRTPEVGTRASHTQTSAKAKSTLTPRQRAFLQAQESRKPLGALWGFGFGVLFLVAGVIAPFVLGQASADERFLMMLGFAPVAITGGLMIALFWRILSRVATPDGKATGPAGFRIGVPVMIGLLLVVLFIVLGMVLLGTLLPILSR